MPDETRTARGSFASSTYSLSWFKGQLARAVSVQTYADECLWVTEIRLPDSGFLFSRVTTSPRERAETTQSLEPPVFNEEYLLLGPSVDRLEQGIRRWV
jgi:hypothetical protein